MARETEDSVPSSPRESTVDIFNKRTKASLQHLAEKLSKPKDNQMKHEILGTCNSDSVYNIDFIVTDTG